MRRRHAAMGGALALWLAAGAAAPATAQVPLSARGLGMAGANVGLARGHEALLLNPANLGLAGNPAWSFASPQVSVGGTAEGFDPRRLPEFLSTGELSAAERADLLDLVPSEGTGLGLDVKLPALTLQNGRFAFGVAYATAGGYRIGRDLVELAVDGYQPGRYDYRVGDTGGERASYLDAAVGHGRSFGAISVGVTGHYYRGLTLTRSRLFEPTYDFETADISLEYAGVYAEGGSGWGVDVGAAFQPMPSVTVSASVANVLSAMDWGEQITVRRIDVTRDQFQMSYRRARGFQKRYNRSDQPLDAATPSHIAALAEGLTDDAGFPATLRTGLGWQPTGSTRIGAAYERELAEARLGGNGWDQVASVGLEQQLAVIGVRAGYATDLGSGTLLSGGLSLGPLQLGVARLTSGAETGRADSEGWIATFGMSTGEYAGNRPFR